MPIDATPETLLSEPDFARTIARALLRDGDADADDVAQDVYLRLADGSARPGVGLRDAGAWLRTMARHLSLDRRRAAARRARHECAVAAARAEAFAPSTADVVQREEMRRAVVDAVLGLGEPYRGVLLQHYWDGVPAATIAARLGVPDATVRAWLHRGRAQLRTWLDATHGRSKRPSALAILAGLPAVAGTKALAGAVSSTARATSTAGSALGVTLWSSSAKSLAAIGVGLLACAALVWWSVGTPQGSSPGPVSPSTPFDLVQVEGGESHEIEIAATRSPIAEQRSDVGARPGPAEFAVRCAATWRGRPYPAALVLEELAAPGPNGFAAKTGEPVAELQCGSDGRCVWRDAVADHERAFVLRSADPSVRGWSSPTPVPAGAVEVELRVEVVPLTCAVRGVVRAAGGGAAIAGARVLINGDKSRAVVTDEEGRYVILSATGDDARPLVLGARGFDAQIVDLEIPDGTTEIRRDVELQAGATLRGRVVDADQRPVAGAVIETSVGTIFEVVTDESGQFVVDTLARGQTIAVYANKPGFCRSTATWSDGEPPLEFVLTRGCRVTGRVFGRSASGPRPIAFPRLTLRSGGPGSVGRRRVAQVGDAEGRFVFEDVTPGTCELATRVPGYASQSAVFEVAVASGAGRDRTIVLDPGMTITGRVVGPDDEPIGGASVYAELHGDDAIDPLRSRAVVSRADSDSSGHFELRDVPVDVEIVVVAHKTDFERGRFGPMRTLGAGELAEIRLRRRPVVLGRVVDAATGAAVTKFAVAVWAAEWGYGPWVEFSEFESADGQFAAQSRQQIRAGTAVKVEVKATGYAPVALDATFGGAEPREPLVARLRPGVRVHGVVRDPSGQPVGDVVLRSMAGVEGALGQRSRRDLTTTANAIGRFELANVPAGPLRFILQHPAYPEVVFGPVEVPSGPGEIEIAPRLVLGVRVAGRLEGFDVSSGAVHVDLFQKAIGGSRGSVTVAASDGRFVIDDVGRGAHYAFVRGLPDGETRLLRFEVGSEGRDDLVLRAAVGDARIVGTAAVGGAAGEARIDWVDAPPGTLSTTRWASFENGGFVFAGLAFGTYRVRVEAEGRTPFDRTIHAQQLETRIELR